MQMQKIIAALFAATVLTAADGQIAERDTAVQQKSQVLSDRQIAYKALTKLVMKQKQLEQKIAELETRLDKCGRTEEKAQKKFAKAIVKPYMANVRIGPGTTFQIVKVADCGDVIGIDSKASDNWYKTAEGNYISASVVEAIKE